MMKQVEEAKVPPEGEDAIASFQVPKSPYRATWPNQFGALLRRSFLEVLREPFVTVVKAFQSLVSPKSSAAL